MFSLRSRMAALAVVCLLSVTMAISAQDETPPGDAPAPSAGSGSETFEQLGGQLKQMIVQLNELKNKYAVAAESERPAIEAEYKELIASGQKLFEKMTPAAEKSFSKNPDIEGEPAKHLFEAIGNAMAQGKAKDADRMVMMLLAKAKDNAQLNGLACLLPFDAGDYKTARERLASAEENGKSPEGAKEMEEEMKIREAEAKADDLPRVKLETSKGTMVIELFENEAPNSVANFISLVEKKFYDGIVFHRVIEGFMAQGGDPTGTGGGGPGYAIECECYAKNHRKHFRGTLSMAHAGRNTGGSQFFLCFGPTPHLNGKHTAFGRVIEGMEVLDKITRIEPGRPGTPDKIVKATVVRKRDHEYKPKTLPDPRS